MLKPFVQKAWEQFWQKDASCWRDIEALSRGHMGSTVKKNALGRIMAKCQSAQKRFLAVARDFVLEEDRDWLVGEMEKAQQRLVFYVAQEVGPVHDVPSVLAMLAPPPSVGPFRPAYSQGESEVCGRLDLEELVNETAGVQAAFKQLAEALAKRA